MAARRSVAGHGGARAAGEQAEHIFQAVSDLLHIQDGDTGGSQLDRQGNTIQALADQAHRGGFHDQIQAGWPGLVQGKADSFVGQQRSGASTLPASFGPVMKEMARDHLAINPERFRLAVKSSRSGDSAAGRQGRKHRLMCSQLSKMTSILPQKSDQVIDGSWFLLVNDDTGNRLHRSDW
jgi:hypothetical protein